MGQCLICGLSNNNIPFIHSNHAICNDCLQIYINQMEAEGKAERAKVKCPACEFQFVYTATIIREKFTVEYSLLYPFTYDEFKIRDVKPIKNCICD